LGIADGPADVVTGAELGRPTDTQSAAWQARLAGRRVFARVDPLQKRAIVEGLAASGHFVAVTGDGVNDAAALRAAHLGVAMGSGTDVARDAASLVVTDDNFASITAAVEEGRFVYANLRGIIRLLVSTGFAEVMLVLLALVAGMPLPLTALQLLWLNLVTNGIQDISLAFEPGDPAEMKKPPRRTDEGVFDATMVRGLVTAGVAMTALSFGLWWWALEGMGISEASARNLVVLLVVMMQNVHTVNCRSETRSIFRSGKAGNPVLWAGVLTAQGVHLLVMQTGFGQRVLGLAPVSPGEWAMLLPLAAVVVLISEIEKWFGRRRAA
jgi:magnesium-transporting ATPase (P-type)